MESTKESLSNEIAKEEINLQIAIRDGNKTMEGISLVILQRLYKTIMMQYGKKDNQDNID